MDDSTHDASILVAHTKQLCRMVDQDADHFSIESHLDAIEHDDVDDDTYRLALACYQGVLEDFLLIFT